MGFNNLLKKINNCKQQYPYQRFSKDGKYVIIETPERHIFVMEYYLLQLSEIKSKDAVEKTKIEETIVEIHLYLAKLMAQLNRKDGLGGINNNLNKMIAYIKEKHANNSNDMLMKAIENNDDELFEASLAAGADVNKKDDMIGTPPALIYAIKHKNFLMAKKLIEANADVNIVYEKFFSYSDKPTTPLIAAVDENDIDIVKLLIANGADVNKGKIPAFIYAVKHKNLAMAKKLLEANADINVIYNDYGQNAPLIDAVKRNDIEMVKLLVASGADVNINLKESGSPLYHSCYLGSPEITEFLLSIPHIKVNDKFRGRDGYPSTVLSAALDNIGIRKKNDKTDVRILEALLKSGKVKKDDNDFKEAVSVGIDAVRLMLDAGYVCTKGILNKAIQYSNDANIIDLLIIQKNADIQSAKEILKSYDSYTDLMFYIAIGDIDAVERLLSRPMIYINDVKAEFKDRHKALMIAAKLGRTEMIPLLVNAGVDVNYANTVGETPLMLAAQYNHTNTVKCLLECHADVNKQTTFGRTALFLATDNGHADVVECLLKVDNIDTTIQTNDDKIAIDLGLKSRDKKIVNAYKQFVDAYKLKNARPSIDKLEGEIQKQIKHFRDNAKSCCFDFGNSKKADKIEEALNRAKKNKSAQFSMHDFLNYHEEQGKDGQRKESIFDALSYDRICFFGKTKSSRQIEDFVKSKDAIRRQPQLKA